MSDAQYVNQALKITSKGNWFSSSFKEKAFPPTYDHGVFTIFVGEAQHTWDAILSMWCWGYKLPL